MPRSKPPKGAVRSLPPETWPAAQWHLDEHLFQMDVIAEPLAELQLDLPPKTAPSAPSPSSAALGVVSTSLKGRFVALPLAREVDELVQTIAAGRSDGGDAGGSGAADGIFRSHKPLRSLENLLTWG
ncbi:hypothetical protein ACVINH_002677 [Rhizobium anhuiense]